MACSHKALMGPYQGIGTISCQNFDTEMSGVSVPKTNRNLLKSEPVRYQKGLGMPFFLERKAAVKTST